MQKSKNDINLATKLYQLSDRKLPFALNKELHKILKKLAKKLPHFNPHFWLADEWFSPAGIGGVAIPYYLLDKKLIELEQDNGLKIEGHNPKDFYKLVAHELGHAVDHAYKLSELPGRKIIFGNHLKAYPNSYIPSETPANYVEFLGDTYASSHPEEDWAETFGLWLTTPKTVWEKKYKNTLALEKLRFMHACMSELKHKKAIIKKRHTPLNIKKDKRSVADIINEKKRNTTKASRYFKASMLKPLKHQHGPLYLSKFIIENQSEICRLVAKKTKHGQYKIKEMINNMAQDTKHLKYKIPNNPRSSLLIISQIMSGHIDSYVKIKDHRIIM